MDYPDAGPVCMGISNYIRTKQMAVIREILDNLEWQIPLGFEPVRELKPILSFEINSGTAGEGLPCLTVFPARTPFTFLTNEQNTDFIDHNLILQIAIAQYDPKIAAQEVFLYCRLLYRMMFRLLSGENKKYDKFSAIAGGLPPEVLKIKDIQPLDFNYFTPGLDKNIGLNFQADPQMAIRVRVLKP